MKISGQGEATTHLTAARSPIVRKCQVFSLRLPSRSAIPSGVQGEDPGALLKRGQDGRTEAEGRREVNETSIFLHMFYATY